MSTANPPAPQRHALNLPAGSIRALLAICILAYMWILALGLTGSAGTEALAGDLAKEASAAFIYLQFLMVLILAHFFSAHGKTIAHQPNRASPLGLPSGTVRVLLLFGYLGLAYFTWQARQSFALPNSGPVLLLVMVLIAAYFIGYLITSLMRWMYPHQLPPWFLDVQAWFAIIGLLLLGVIVLGRLINTSLTMPMDLNLVEAILAGIVGFYFGARS